jgi:hypothetical protein
VVKRALLIGLAGALAACGGSGSKNPAAPESPRVLQGQTVSAIDGSPSGGLTVAVGTHFAVASDANGNFQVDVGGPGAYDTQVIGTPIVERHTTLTGPSIDRLKVSLIPAGFDLAAFDEMFRTANSRLQRWTSRPVLVIVASVMKYASNESEHFPATADQLTDDEVTALTAHLTEGLSLLTAGTFTSFASVTVERPQAGEQVNVRRTGAIVVGRYTGITTLANTIGYGNWAEQPDGTIVGGTMWLDRDFDRDDSRRRLLRIHELGHALGYNHVTLRTSIMNPAIGPEPTDFDRAGSAIAFQRPVGNVAPDTDPATGRRTFSVSDGGLRWSTPIQ